MNYYVDKILKMTQETNTPYIPPVLSSEKVAALEISIKRWRIAGILAAAAETVIPFATYEVIHHMSRPITIPTPVIAAYFFCASVTCAISYSRERAAKEKLEQNARNERSICTYKENVEEAAREKRKAQAKRKSFITPRVHSKPYAKRRVLNNKLAIGGQRVAHQSVNLG